MGNASSKGAEGAIMLGCVAYAENIGTIWEGMRQYFLSKGVPFDFVMYSSYDRQVEALLRGHIDIAWNGPLAHARVQKRTGGRSVSLGMRDSDRGFCSLLVVAEGSAIEGAQDLRGKKVATGAYDSPQAYVLPLQALAALPDGEALLKSIHLVRFDRDLGKHGDTAAGELAVLEALGKGEVDAGFVSGVMWQRALDQGDVNKGGKPRLRAIPGVVPAFDHCQFDARPGLSADKRVAFTNALFAMTMKDPDQKKVLQAEGVREAWMPPREEGYEAMRAAIAAEPAEPFPAPRDTPESHRFASLEVRGDTGFGNTKFVRACT